MGSTAQLEPASERLEQRHAGRPLVLLTGALCTLIPCRDSLLPATTCAPSPGVQQRRTRTIDKSASVPSIRGELHRYADDTTIPDPGAKSSELQHKHRSFNLQRSDYTCSSTTDFQPRALLELPALRLSPQATQQASVTLPQNAIDDIHDAHCNEFYAPQRRFARARTA